MANITVLYDHLIFTQQSIGGISKYHAELIARFEQSNEISGHLPYLIGSNEYAKNLAADDVVDYFYYPSFKGQYYLNRFFNHRSSLRALKKQDFDLFHPTDYSPYFLPYLGDKPFVITIHDMTHEIYPEYFQNQDYSRYKRTLCEKAARIIAISEYTKQDLVRIFEIDEDRIEVIYHGSPAIIPTPQPIDLPGRYLLFVGRRSRYKQFDFFLKTITPLLKNQPDLHLLCIGGGSFTQAENDLIRDLAMSEKVFQRYVSEKELAYCYQQAEMLVFPSLYEGFGLPILEAYQYRCPVVLSNASCFPEIAEDAAAYFDPNNKESIRDVVEKVLKDPSYKHQLVQKGLKRAAHFTWEQTAKQTAALYRQLVRS